MSCDDDDDDDDDDELPLFGAFGQSLDAACGRAHVTLMCTGTKYRNEVLLQKHLPVNKYMNDIPASGITGPLITGRY